MAWIEGFCGIRYNLQAGRDISDRLAPPYDVIKDQAGKDALLAKSQHCIAAIDLPHVPPKTAGPAQAYQRSAELLDQWLETAILIKEATPAIYVYQQRFSNAGQEYLRRGFIARLKLEELGAHSVFPHEQTYDGPKEDRLALTKATEAGISQVFCLFEDQDNDLTEQLYSHITGPADYYGKLDDVQNEVWVLTQGSALNAVHQGMLSRRVFIADGHHRYGTALLYRQWLAQQQGGKLGEDHPANFLACMFVSMAEPGLLVLPTHRTILGVKQVNLDKIAAALTDKFHLRWKKLQEVADPQALLEQSDPAAFGLASGGDDRLLVAWPKQVDALLEDLADKYSAVWRTLQVAIVHNYVLDRVIFKDSGTGSEELRIEYAHACGPALDAAAGCQDSLVVLLQPVSMDAVRQVSLAGDLMPQKSTYFFPKIATGLVIYPLA